MVLNYCWLVKLLFLAGAFNFDNVTAINDILKSSVRNDDSLRNSKSNNLNSHKKRLSLKQFIVDHQLSSNNRQLNFESEAPYANHCEACGSAVAEWDKTRVLQTGPIRCIVGTFFGTLQFLFIAIFSPIGLFLLILVSCVVVPAICFNLFSVLVQFLFNVIPTGLINALTKCGDWGGLFTRADIKKLLNETLNDTSVLDNILNKDGMRRLTMEKSNGSMLLMGKRFNDSNDVKLFLTNEMKTTFDIVTNIIDEVFDADSDTVSLHNLSRKLESKLLKSRRLTIGNFTSFVDQYSEYSSSMDYSNFPDGSMEKVHGNLQSIANSLTEINDENLLLEFEDDSAGCNSTTGLINLLQDSLLKYDTTEIPDSIRRFLQSRFQRDSATNKVVCTEEEILFCNLMSKPDSLFIVQEEETKEDVGP